MKLLRERAADRGPRSQRVFYADREVDHPATAGNNLPIDSFQSRTTHAAQIGQ